MKNNEFDAKKLAFLKPEELNPEKFEKIIKKKEIEEHKKNNKATTNAFKLVNVVKENALLKKNK